MNINPLTAHFFDRRGFLKAGSLATLTSLLSTEIVFANQMPPRYLPVVFDVDLLVDKDKNLVVLNNKPWNVETLTYLLDDAVTPADRMFIRNNGLTSEKIDLATWKLTINGESVKAPKTYTLADLKTKFKPYTYQLVLECAGNGRSGYFPKTAVYIEYYGQDLHISGDPKQAVISRGVPMRKALEDETLVAWAMNGQAIPPVHGYPLRLVVGGWPASVSGKWLHTIAVRNKVHDGAKMTGKIYRVPIHPVQPGIDHTSSTASKSGTIQHDPESGLVIDETMPIVKGQCTACHSSKLILQSHFNREKWIERIRWMQRAQKLWDLGETGKPILDYLAKYYSSLATSFDGRRLPLPAQTWHKQ